MSEVHVKRKKLLRSTFLTRCWRLIETRRRTKFQRKRGRKTGRFLCGPQEISSPDALLLQLNNACSGTQTAVNNAPDFGLSNQIQTSEETAQFRLLTAKGYTWNHTGLFFFPLHRLLVLLSLEAVLSWEITKHFDSHCALQQNWKQYDRVLCEEVKILYEQINRYRRCWKFHF